MEILKTGIVGPSPKLKVSGGVANHIKILTSLNCFKDVVVLDPSARGSSYRNTKFSRTLGWIKFYLELLSLKQLIINSSLYPGSLFKLSLILFLCTFSPIKIVNVFFHGGVLSQDGYIPSKLLVFIIRKLSSKVNCFYFLTEEQKAQYVTFFRISNAKIYRNYSNFEDASEHKNIRTDEPIVLAFVARITEEKGVFYAVDAIKQLNKFAPKRYVFNIAGDGPKTPDLIKEINQIENINFLGFLTGEELGRVYQDAHIVLLPTSHPEGFPYTYIESMRFACPLISTNRGALTSLVLNGHNGYKVPEKSSDEIVDAILALAETPEVYEQLSQNCISEFEKSLSKHCAERFYLSVLMSA